MGTTRTNRELLLATTNEGKLQELATLLRDLSLGLEPGARPRDSATAMAAAPSRPWTLLRPSDIGLTLLVPETGASYVENAVIKARAYFERTGVPTLGEDSGIEIDALSGEPGALSARYHGLADGATKNAHILDLLAGVPRSRRGCRYVCTMVLVDADGRKRVFEGVCAGRIAEAPAGTGGFGFDPIFFVPRLGRTMAQLTEAEKNRISHRGRAARKLVRHLQAGRG